jgi:hypothetical protein
MLDREGDTMNPKTITAAVAVSLASVTGGYVALDQSSATYRLIDPDVGVATESRPNGCLVPDCRGWGGWDEHHAEVDCRGTGPLGLPDGGPRWLGCVSEPAEAMTGKACLPSVCALAAGVDPLEKVR